ncbi:MAG: YdcF family protein [Corynebacterium sp.]|uniref:YdcF family protein n=1 Tax=Corynebacterium sp. TaxID=1720 RepID=UPI0026E0E330|nr:YdcF family protein [Corynebacterium sp.]MDO5668950.1 YdcF family protein [Corynebacterium sp.]
MLIDVPRALFAALFSTALLSGAPAQASSFSLSSIAAPDDPLPAAAAFSADYAGDDEFRSAALVALPPAHHGQVTLALDALHSPVVDPEAVAVDSPIIVLGERLNEDGTLRSNLIHRLETARQLAQARPAVQVVVTGGPTGPGGTEAHAMRDWLLRHGITVARVEDRSTSTVDSARFARELLPAATSVIVVTSENHLPRAVVDFTLAFGSGVAGLGSPDDPPEGMRVPKWTYRDAVFWFPE